jgi:hypothetical protein
MVAFLATIVAGGQALIQSTLSLINIHQFLYNLLNSTKPNCPRPPTHQAAWIHQIHAAGGASGSITMVMVFVRSFVIFVHFF